MASVLTNQAFELYSRHGVRGGTPLSHEQFDEFWHALSAEQKVQWEKLLARGPTALTTETMQSSGTATLTPSAIDRAKTRSSR